MTALRHLIIGGFVALLVLTPEKAAAQSDHGFRFVRIKYANNATGWVSRFGDTWSHDYPTAEYNFYEALERTTRIHAERPSLVLTLDDPQIFEYPILYLCEPGYWEMTDAEVESLREYFDRGGFMLFDDFRGEDEWYQLYSQIKRLYPDREPVELPNDHSIWSIYYEVDPVATPSLVGGPRGRGSGREFDTSRIDRYFGVFDDNGRLMMMICYNQDLGDGWEWPEFNEQDASLATFQMGVNFLIYSLTH
ncbi:MAG: DUF4159 domain-containing protein [Rhodothermales bacterium]|nr:DUF4159 domain-containing protein [Rhodothermales bacterium]